MADQTVTLTKKTGNATFSIDVDKPAITLEANQTITFNNQLSPQGELQIQFFASPANKYEYNAPITGFCEVDGSTIGDTLVVPKSDSKECRIVAAVSKDDQILYSVTAIDTPGATEYATLDPVVIIDGPDSLLQPQVPGVHPLLVAVAAVAGLLIGYMIWGRRKPQ